jgi:hypothetical protein
MFWKKNEQKNDESENHKSMGDIAIKKDAVPAEIIIPQKEKSRWYILLLVVIPMAGYFWFGLQHLTQFETADEHLWISDLYTGRIQQYWNAIEQKDWEKTRINDKPGVSLALISGMNYKKEGDVQEKMINKQTTWSIYNPDKAIESYQLYRFPIVIANGILGFFFFVALWRLTKKHWLALAGGSFVVLSPVLIGISQIINPDAFLWSFSFAAILSFALFLQKNKWWLHIIDGLLAAIFLAMALLSKYVALVLVPFFLVMLLWYVLDDYKTLVENERFRRKIIAVTLGYPLIVAASIGLFALLMPAVLVKPGLLNKSIFEFGGMKNILIICLAVDLFFLLDAIILKSFLVKFASKYLQWLKIWLPKFFYLGMIILFATVIINWGYKNNALGGLTFFANSAKSSLIEQAPAYLQLISQAQPLTFALTPIVLGLMFFVWAKSIVRRSEFDYLIFILSTFFIVYFYAVTEQRLLLQVRYSLILFPIAATLAGIGFYELIKTLKHRYSIVLFALLFWPCWISIDRIQPYYFAYANDLLPKNMIISDSWGYGGYEAIRYIESQGKEMKNMKIWTDYYGSCQFFSGKCVMEGQVKWAKNAEIMNIDYVISTHDGIDKNKAGLKRINEIFPTDNPVWKLEIDGRPDNFVKVYKNENKQISDPVLVK